MSKSEVQITDTQHVEQVDPMVVEERALVEKRLVRKIDMRLMPMLWLLMVFSYLVSTNLLRRMDDENFKQGTLT